MNIGPLHIGILALIVAIAFVYAMYNIFTRLSALETLTTSYNFQQMSQGNQ